MAAFFSRHGLVSPLLFDDHVVLAVHELFVSPCVHPTGEPLNRTETCAVNGAESVRNGGGIGAELNKNRTGSE